MERCAANIAATNVPAQMVAERTSIKSSFTDVPQTTGIIARHDIRVHLIAPFSRTPFEAAMPFETNRSTVRSLLNVHLPSNGDLIADTAAGPSRASSRLIFNDFDTTDLLP